MWVFPCSANSLRVSVYEIGFIQRYDVHNVRETFYFEGSNVLPQIIFTLFIMTSQWSISLTPHILCVTAVFSSFDSDVSYLNISWWLLLLKDRSVVQNTFTMRWNKTDPHAAHVGRSAGPTSMSTVCSMNYTADKKDKNVCFTSCCSGEVMLLCFVLSSSSRSHPASWRRRRRQLTTLKRKLTKPLVTDFS